MVVEGRDGLVGCGLPPARPFDGAQGERPLRRGRTGTRPAPMEKGEGIGDRPRFLAGHRNDRGVGVGGDRGIG